MARFKKTVLAFQTQEIESDPELQRMLRESELDEKAGRVYTRDEAIKFIRECTPEKLS